MTMFPFDAERKRFSGLLLIVLAFFPCLFLLPLPGTAAQTPEKTITMPDAGRVEEGREVALPASEEEIDKEIARLQTRLEEVRSRASSSPGEGIPGKGNGLGAALPEEVAEWQRLTFETVYLLENHMNSLQDLKEIRKANRERATERNEWKGFSEKPPYPVSFLEDLYATIKDKQFEMQMAEVKRRITEGGLRESLRNLEKAGKDLRDAEEHLASGREGEPKVRAIWLRDLAKRRYELAEVGALSLETQRLVLDEDLDGKRDYLPFLERQYRLAESVSPLSRGDLEQKLQELEIPAKSLNDRLTHALAEEEEARQALEKDRDALHRAQESVPHGQEPAKEQRETIDHLKSALEAEKTLLDTTRLKVDITKGMLRQLTVEQKVWEDRYRLGEKKDPQEIRKLSEENRQMLEHIRLWKNSLEDGMGKLASMVSAQRDKLSSGGLSDGEEQVARTFITAYSDRGVLYRQALRALNRTERVGERWASDLDALEKRLSNRLGIMDRLKTLSAYLRQAWDTELYVAEESAIVEGRKISRPISVTTGKISKALLILVLGLWAARRLKGPVERFAVRRFGTDENGAKQIGRKWSFFTFAALFSISLASVNVPLAVFAFFGGTLAIAAGFGAQHLIGNVLSSVILLFDRTVQVGDVVEVDGHRGRVTAIGMRSSSILRFDGVEMLVPNSQFLEQRVTNWTHSSKQVRYEIALGVAYQSPTQKVSDLILQVVKEDPRTLTNPAPYVFFEEFGDSALMFRVYLWLILEIDEENRSVLSNIRHRIKEALDEAGIVIALPQRDVHLDAMHPIPVQVVDDERARRGDVPRTGSSHGR
jgi:potassium-dependent mechanosensitive channel